MSALHEAVLPPLRTDLQIHPAPPDADGADQATVYDPYSGKYKRLRWAEATLLTWWRPGLTLEQFRARIHQGSTLRVTTEELALFLRQADAAGLTRRSQYQSATSLEEMTKKLRPGWVAWILRNYLYIRIPLIKPDRFLRNTLPLVRLLVSTPAIVLYAILIMLGFLMLPGRFSQYISTFPQFFSLQGALTYGVLMIGVKALHEFAHAYTARALGVPVRLMGIILLVLYPMPFSDVTDAWRLRTRMERFWIGIAGVLAEMVLGGIALFGWCVAPEASLLQGACFVLSSVTLVTTILANLNPAMRFDGYYILSDLWGVDNLQPRAFALTKWWLRKMLLGFRVPPPEPVPDWRRLGLLILYSLYAWMYRLGLYIGIAVMVYTFFHKSVGIVLFAVEIWSFIVMPLLKEGATLYRMRGHFTLNPHLIGTVLVLAGLVAWAAWPLPRTRMIPAIILPETSQVVYAPVEGVVREMHIARGAQVQANDPLLALSNETLETRCTVLEQEIRILEARERIASVREDEQASLPQLAEELAKVRAELKSVTETLAQMVVRAAVAGEVLVWDENLAPGVPVAEGAALGRIADTQAITVHAYLRESELNTLPVGSTAAFYPAHGGDPIPVTITAIRPARLEVIEHRSLTSVQGGDIPVLPDARGRLVPVESYFEAECTLLEKAAPAAPLWLSGHIRFRSKPESHLQNFAQYAWTVILRESSF